MRHNLGLFFSVDMLASELENWHLTETTPTQECHLVIRPSSLNPLGVIQERWSQSDRSFEREHENQSEEGWYGEDAAQESIEAMQSLDPLHNPVLEEMLPKRLKMSRKNRLIV